MNKTTKTVLIIALCLFGVGLLVFFGTSVVTGYKLSNLSGSAGEVIVAPDDGGTVMEKEFESAKQDIEIDVSFAKVTVGNSKDGKIHLTYTDSSKVTFELKSSNEKIKLSQNQQLFNFFGSIGTHASVELLIPANHKGSLELDSASGNLVLSNLALPTDIDVSTASGKVTISDCTCDELDISTASGDVELSAIEANAGEISTASGRISSDGVIIKGEYELGTSSGAIRIKDSKLGEVSMGTHSGSMYFSDSKAKICNVSSSSADCEFENAEADSFNISTISGSVLGTIKGSPDDYTISTKTVSGDDSLRNLGGSGKKTISVSATSGDIELSFTK